MEQNANEELKQKIIKEQDVLIYYFYNCFEEGLCSETIGPDVDYSYRDVGTEIISKNLDLIPNLSMNNLLYLLGSSDEATRKAVQAEIMKKFDEGEHVFSGENAQTNAFGIVSDVWNLTFSRLGKENIERVIKSIDKRYDDCKESDPEAFEVIKKFGPYAALDNFFDCYDKGIITPDKFDFIKRVVESNPNILTILNFGVFDDSILELGEEFVTRAAHHPNFSNNLIRLSRSNPKLFELIKGSFQELEETKSVPEATKVEFSVLRYVTRKSFEIGEDVDIVALQNCALRNQEILQSVVVDYSEDYERKFQEACDEAYSKERYLDDKKDILFTKYFGMSKNTADKFFNQFRHINQLGEQEGKIKEYLDAINQVREIKDIAELDKLYSSMEQIATPLERVAIEYDLREKFTKTISEAVKSTDDNIKSSEDVQYIDFEGSKIKQVKLNGNFNLLVHSTDSGFRVDKEIPDGDFVKAWDEVKDPTAHLVSSCFINQDFLGHVPAGGNGVLAVFADVGTEDLSLMGPTDINSHITNYNYEADVSMYMTAENLPYYSRKVYNEIPIERKRPNYFLVFDDTPEEILQNTYKSAQQFGATIIYADKREIEQNQLQNLDNMMKEFEETGNLDTLQRLVSTYETNVAGWLLNRDSSKTDDSLTQNINNERFRSDFEQRESAIYGLITEYVKENYGQEGYEAKLSQIAEIMQSEIDKYQMTDLEKVPISQVKMKFNASGLLEKMNILLTGKGEVEEVLEPASSTISLGQLVENAVTVGDKVGMQDLHELSQLREKMVDAKDKEGQDYGE